MRHSTQVFYRNYLMYLIAFAHALIFSSTVMAQNVFDGSPNNTYWQKQNNNLLLKPSSDGKTLSYNRNWAPYAQYEIYADVPTIVGHVYRLVINFDENRTNNTFVNLNVDGKRVSSSSQIKGTLNHGFIAKKTMTRISLGGSNNWLASFVITNIFLGSIGGHLQTGTFVGSLFSDMILDITSPDLSSRCTANICKLKFVPSNYGPTKNTLRLYLGEIPSAPIGIAAGNRVTGVSSNFVDALNSGLYIEIDFLLGTSEADISVQKDSMGRYNIKVSGN